MPEIRFYVKWIAFFSILRIFQNEFFSSFSCVSIRLLFIPTIILLFHYFLNIGLQIRIAILINQENGRKRLLRNLEKHESKQNDQQVTNEATITYTVQEKRPASVQSKRSTVWKFEHFSTNLYVKSICCNFNSKYVRPNWFLEISVMLEKTSNFHTVVGQDEKRNIHHLHQVHRHLPQIQNRDGSS